MFVLIHGQRGNHGLNLWDRLIEFEKFVEFLFGLCGKIVGFPSKIQEIFCTEELPTVCKAYLPDSHLWVGAPASKVR